MNYEPQRASLAERATLRHRAVIRAYDKKTGAIVGELSIPGQMGSMPMTYMAGGKQYIAFTVGAPMQPAELIALALPE